VSFEDIHTDSRNGVGVLSYTTTLYSAKAKKFLLRKTTEGNALVSNHRSLAQIFSQEKQSGNLREAPVHCDNYLECMFTSAVRFSTEELFLAIAAKQRK
jgi:hypothetical protein